MSNKITKYREIPILKSLLKRKNIPQRSWTRVLSEIIGGTQKTAAKRLADESTLSLGELFTIADHFKTTVTAMLQANFPEEKIMPGARKALLKIGKAKCPCTVVTRKTEPRETDCLVAYTDEDENQLIVCSKEDVPTGIVHQGVLNLHVDTFGSSGPVVIILDDEETATLPLCRFIQIDGGFNTKYFKYSKSVLALLQEKPYPDAYILDWTLSGGETSRSLIEAIRRVDENCPIILLTGTIQARTENESDIAELVRIYNIDVLLKPFPASIIVEKLKSVLSQTSQIYSEGVDEY